MRSLYFTADESGLTRSQLRWGEAQGRWRRVARITYRFGPEPVSPLDQALGVLLAEAGIASGSLAGVLHGLDAVELLGPDVTVEPTSAHKRSKVRRRVIQGHVVDVTGFPCSGGLQTMVDLAHILDDLRWEQALESALRKKLVAIAEIDAALPGLGAARTPGVARMRRVLELRPPGAPPTESLLETLAVQLIRTVAGATDPTRQVTVRDVWGEFVARVDLAWPEIGLFIELDGQHHEGQPVYDANRETAVVATMGWLCGRFTWDEIVLRPRATARRLAALIEQAKRRALPAAAF